MPIPICWCPKLNHIPVWRGAAPIAGNPSGKVGLDPIHGISSTIGPNEQSEISVIVRDAQFNLVKNQIINFVITNDDTGGSLAGSPAVTDSQGQA